MDQGATISAVTKSYDSTLVKIEPSPNTSAAMALATVNMLRVAFPFSTATAVENHATGQTCYHVLLHTDSDEFKNACTVVSEFRSVRALMAASNTALFFACCTYAALLYASATVAN